MAADLPSGTVTFLFTDIEGSTQLWEKYPKAMETALARHDEILREAIKHNHGHIIKTTGDGVHAAFETALDGLSAALHVQQALVAEKWEEIEPHKIKVRMGLHTGEAEVRAGDYYGPALNRAARLLSIGHGGQTLLSSTTADLVRDRLPEAVSIRDLGGHLLKDLVRPEHVFQLTHPNLPAEFPPLKSIDSHPNNLPVQLTSFIGRRRELAEAEERLASARLLTLIGSGGTGKTRLCLQIGADLLPNFADGVWLVELAPLGDPALVPSTVASVLGLRAQLGMSLNELLVDFLRDKELLLILDNCEHLLDGCAQLVGRLLRVCANLKVLAGSREALGIAGETVYRVPSLSLPDPAEVGRVSLNRSESAQLFIERALAANRKFEVSDKNASSVAQICRRLDGIPLALELAAACVSVFSVEQVAARLDDRFRLLTGGSRTALPRQQTLRALIDWSYDLLSDEERALVRRLSVFAGGWTFEAAEMVCARHDVLNNLTRLVNKSIVTVDEEADEPRYRFLETVRQYAREKLLEMGGSEEACNAHLQYFMQFVEEAGVQLTQFQGMEALVRLEAEYDNLRAALDWGLGQNVEAVLRMVCLLSNYWIRRGQEAEGCRWAAEALKRSESLPEPEGGAARRLLALRAYSYEALAEVAFSQGDNVLAASASEQAAAMARELGDTTLLSTALGYEVSVKFIAADRTDPGTKPLLENAIAAARQTSDKFSSGVALTMSGANLVVSGDDADRGYKLIEEGLTDLQESGNRGGTAAVVLGLGLMAKFMGDYPEARRRFAALEPIFSETGDVHRVNMVRSELAHIERYEGHYQRAKTMYRETILEWKRIGHRAAIAHQLESLASIARMEEHNQRAARLFGAAEALREKIEIPMTTAERVEYEREIAGLKSGMGESVFASVWVEGRKMNMDQAIDFARE